MTENITLVTPPSLFLPAISPRILLIGEGQAWKNNIIKMLKGETKVSDADFSDVTHLPTVYYCDKEEDYNWLYYQLPHMHQLIFYYSEETCNTGSVFFGHLVSDQRLAVLHDNSENVLNSLFLYADNNKRLPTTNPTEVLVSVYNACY